MFVCSEIQCERAEERGSLPSGALHCVLHRNTFCIRGSPCSPGGPQVGPSPRLPARQLGRCARPSHWRAPVRRDLPRHSHTAVHTRGRQRAWCSSRSRPSRRLLGVDTSPSPAPGDREKPRKPVSVSETVTSAAKLLTGQGEAWSHLRGSAVRAKSEPFRWSSEGRAPGRGGGGAGPPVISGWFMLGRPSLSRTPVGVVDSTA